MPGGLADKNSDEDVRGWFLLPPLKEVLARARELTKGIDAELQSSKLPEKPDFDAADELLKLCRREAARRSLGIGSAVTVFHPEARSINPHFS